MKPSSPTSGSKSNNILDERPTLPPISSLDSFVHNQSWASFDEYSNQFPLGSATRPVSGNDSQSSKSNRSIRAFETFEASKEMFSDHLMTGSHREPSGTNSDLQIKEHNSRNTSLTGPSTFQTQNMTRISIHPQRGTFQEPNQNSTNYESLSQRSIGSSSSNSIQTASSFASPTSNSIEKCIDEVTHHCNMLSQDMTHRKFAILQQQEEYFNNSSLVHPWFDEMIGRANEVLNALLRLKKYQLASEHPVHIQTNSRQGKRSGKQSDKKQGTSSKANTTKDSDETGNHLSLPGQRRRAKKPAFQGRCHSCNTSETPEWRRGPNGARTLCNACGLHYAKLNKKKASQERETKEAKEEENTIMK